MTQKQSKFKNAWRLNNFFLNKKILITSFIFVLLLEIIKLIATVARPKNQIAWVTMFNCIAIILLVILIFLLFKFNKIKVGKFFVSTAIFLQACYTVAFSLYSYPKTPVQTVTSFVCYLLFSCLILALFINTLVLHADICDARNEKTLKAIEIIDLIVVGVSLIFSIMCIVNLSKGFTNEKLVDFFGYISFGFLIVFLTSCDVANMQLSKKNKLPLKIVFSTIGLPVLSLFTLAHVDISTLTYSKCQDHRRFFRDAIEANPTLVDLPITRISMLASHDALSDGINLFSGINDYQNSTLTSLANAFGKGMVVRFSRAQKDSIYDQLNAGVRYIDARVCHVKGTYYNSHTFLSDPLEHNLKLILQWLDENPGEFIIFHVYYFYDAAVCGKETTKTIDDEWADFKDFIESVKYKCSDGVERNLFDFDYTLKDAIDGTGTIEDAQFGNLTYSKVCPVDSTNGERKAGAVIYFSSDRTSTEAPVDGTVEQRWSTVHNYYEINYSSTTTTTDNINKPCALKMNSKLLVDHVLNNTKTTMTYMGIKYDGSAQTDDGKLYEHNTLRYIQTQTTPTTDDIPYMVTSWSLIQKAYEHNNYMLFNSGINWSDLDNDTEQTPCIFRYYPIYMCDYSTSNETGFNTDLINQMIKFNSNLKAS